MRPAIDSGIVTDDAPVSYWPIFSQSLETVPEVFAKVNSAHFPSGFKSGESVLHQWQQFFVTSSRFFYFNRYGQKQSGGTLVLGTRGKFNQIIKLKIHAGRVKYNLFCVFFYCRLVS